ncbi:SPW repeat protein [Rhizobium laguerreae]|uniref:SPW repeat protein n=1 Tax=Rhizobium laguerreae TaxID=1076926 RepID=UPI0021B1132B|nr:SPW repeat protein [Rhizobium laguerreae]
MSAIDDKDPMSAGTDLRIRNAAEKIACFDGMDVCVTGLNVRPPKNYQRDLASPWVLGFSAVAAAMWARVIIGIVIAFGRR